MRRPRLRIGLNIALLAILAWLPLGAVRPVSANHETGFYLAAILTRDWKETFCVEDAGSSMSFADAYGRVNAALTWENPGGDWHGLNNWEIEFEDAYVPTGVGCNGLNTGTWPRFTDTEIRYYVRDPGNLPSICGGTSCAARDMTGASWNNGVEWQFYNVYLHIDPMRGDDQGNPDRRRHTVNHETGHVFGLDDGGPTAESVTGNTSCPQSIMHPLYYGCDGAYHNGIYGAYVPRYAWPQGIDFQTVTNITNRR